MANDNARSAQSPGLSNGPEFSHGAAPTRSQRLRAALSYGKGKVPVFPCKPDKRPIIPRCPDAKKKKLVGKELAEHARTCRRGGHGFHDATTDRSRIIAYWTAHREASIGVPANEQSGFWVLDVDRPEALDELEAKIGKLPTTLTVRTPRGGWHLYFQHAEGVGNSPGELPEGLDVRGGNKGYVLVPPSPGYSYVDRSPVAEAPPQLLELIRKKPPASQAIRQKTRPGVDGERIAEGQRNSTLFFAALSLKDKGLALEGVLEDLLATNEQRCAPPLDPVEVERIAKSAMRYPVRSGTPSPEVVEAIEKLEREWWERPWRGMGGKTDRDVYRVLLELARRFGRLQDDGSVSVSASVRSVALAAATRYETISGRATKRMKEEGLILKEDADRTATEAATWVLIPQAPRGVTTRKHIAASMYQVQCVYDQLRRRLWDLETPAFRWTGHVKKGRAGVLYVLEAAGPMSLRELAELMGWGNHRELKRRYVVPLIGLGLVEDREGLLALPEDHAERVEEIRRAPYTTIRRRRRESQDGDRVVVWVETTENTASEVEREAKDRAAHEKQREKFHLFLVRGTPEADAECRELLNALDEEREAAAVVEADGFIEDLEKVNEVPQRVDENSYDRLVAARMLDIEEAGIV